MDRVFLRRINKEIEYINNNYYYINKYSYIINDFLKNIKCTVNTIEYCKNHKYYLQILYCNNFYFELDVPIDYPFSPYSMYKHKFSNYVGYSHYLVELSKKIRNFDQTMMYFFYAANYSLKPKFINSENKCYCCTSLLCFHNWNVSSKLIDLLLEFHEVDYMDKYIKDKDLHIKNKENFTNTYFNKLSDDIIMYICDFITS